MRERQVPVEVGELLQDRVVALRLDDDRGERRSSSPPRGSSSGRRCRCSRSPRASVGAAARRGLLERVEVHAHEVDELDPVLLGRDHVRRVVAAGEQAGVELRVQRLDPAVHDLREAGEVVDRADAEARGLERLRRPAGGDELDAERRRGPGRTRRCPSCRRRRAARGGSGPRLAASRRPDDSQRRDQHAPRVGRVDPDRVAGDQPHRLAQQLVLDRAQRASRTASASVASGRSSARWRMIAPGVDALVDEVDGDAEHLDAVGERLLDRADPGEGGQQRRVDVDHALRGSGRGRPGLSSCM